MDNYEKLSNEAKQAWQRGFDLAYPRNWGGSMASDRPGSEQTNDAQARIHRAVDAVARALETVNRDGCKSMLAVKSGQGVGMVVMDPMSVEAVLGELDHMESDECREALGDGFLRGMIAKARAAEIGAAETGELEAGPLLMN